MVIDSETAMNASKAAKTISLLWTAKAPAVSVTKLQVFQKREDHYPNLMICRSVKVVENCFSFKR